MLGDALHYPFDRDDSVKNILIGGLLIFPGMLLLYIPALISYGYVFRSFGTAARGEEPPEFTDYGGMLVDGLKLAVVGFIYAIIPLVVFFAFGAGGALLSGVGGDTANAAGAGTSFVGFLVSAVLFLLVYYVLPGAIAHMSVQGTFGSAFDFGTLTDLWTTGDYLVAWLLALVIGLIVGVVAFVLQITIVGIILLGFVYFYQGVAVAYLFGTAYGEAIGA